MNCLCATVGCGQIAEWTVQGRMWPVGWGPKAESLCVGGVPKAPATFSVGGLEVCSGCKETLTPDDLINDEGWETIRQAFISNGLTEPDRESIEIFFEPLIMGNA